ncbi:EAL domain-containing protein [Streptomyces sp. NPDC001054]
MPPSWWPLPATQPAASRARTPAPLQAPHSHEHDIPARPGAEPPRRDPSPHSGHRPTRARPASSELPSPSRARHAAPREHLGAGRHLTVLAEGLPLLPEHSLPRTQARPHPEDRTPLPGPQQPPAPTTAHPDSAAASPGTPHAPAPYPHPSLAAPSTFLAQAAPPPVPGLWPAPPPAPAPRPPAPPNTAHETAPPRASTPPAPTHHSPAPSTADPDSAAAPPGPPHAPAPHPSLTTPSTPLAQDAPTPSPGLWPAPPPASAPQPPAPPNTAHQTVPPRTSTPLAPAPTDPPPDAPHRAAFDAAPLPMALVDEAGTITAANPALHDYLALPAASLPGRPLTHLTALGLTPHTTPGLPEVFTGRRHHLVCTRRIASPRGGETWAELRLEHLASVRGALLTVRDTSLGHDLRARLRTAEREDPLTRLAGRAHFLDRLADTLEEHGLRGGRGRVGLCVLGLDGFRHVNTAHGHLVGDHLLRAVAARLARLAPLLASAHGEAPVLARLGGDEFALLVGETTGPGQLTELAATVLRELREPYDIAGRRLAVSASAGVAELRARETSPAELLRAVTTALGWAKAEGRGRWALFDSARCEDGAHQDLLATALRPAVRDGEFELEYQPLVALADGTLHGVEALVRWRHPRFGRLAPNRFIDVAERDGSIVELGRWVLRTACAQARSWQLARPGARPPYVSVNVTVRQLWDSDVVADVADVLAETRLPPSLLQLELTESEVVGQTGRPLRALQELSDMGVRIAIDDFGTGYSNLSYLSRLPVSVLKLDGSFVRGFPFTGAAQGAEAQGAEPPGAKTPGAETPEAEPPAAATGAPATGAATAAPVPGPLATPDRSAAPGSRDREAATVIAGGPARSTTAEGRPADEVIVEALVGLAHRLGLTVTAECVETRGQAERLRAMGCDMGQGYLYSRPVPPERIGLLLETTGRCPGWPTPPPS